MIVSYDFLAILAFIELLALFAIVAAVLAFFRLWYSGDKGWGRASVGLVLGLLLLSPLLYASYLYPQYPTVNDVSTSAEPSPPLVFVNNPDSTRLSGEAAATAFVGAATRTYPMDPAPVFDLVEQRMLAQGWQVRRKIAPTDREPVGEIHALATTWFGWRDEIAIRVKASSFGTVVDMRSASLVGHTDFGKNGRRVAQFLGGLDDDVAKVLKGNS